MCQLNNTSELRAKVCHLSLNILWDRGKANPSLVWQLSTMVTTWISCTMHLPNDH